MPRPHLEFLQSQVLPWGEDVALPGARAKVLSADAATGEATLLLSVPPGWEATPRRAHDEEVFVLRGALEAGPVAVAAHGYARLPAGLDGRWRSAGGALAILCRNAPAPDAEVLRLDTLRMPWTATQAPHIAHLNAFRKNLWVDPGGRGRTYLLAGLPQGMPVTAAEPLEVHPNDNEAFLISGDLSTWVGTMRPGAYIWRPPEKWHGADCTATGFFFFMRTPGASVTTWRLADTPHPVSLNPPHAPILPPDLRAPMAAPFPDPLDY